MFEFLSSIHFFTIYKQSSSTSIFSVNMSTEDERTKIQEIINTLETARGEGTTLITLMVKPQTEMANVITMLTQELGTITSIKSRTVRQNIQGVITTALERVKNYEMAPTNGLVLFCGTVKTEEGEEKQITIDFEPFKPVSNMMYLCDNKFHVEPLQAMLE